MPVSAPAPIDAADVPAVAAFLHEHLNHRVSAAAWAAALVPPWYAAAPEPPPNHGFLIRDEAGEVVGVQLAFYATREVGGRPERFCNLGAWCVLPDHRARGLRLLTTALAQPGYHFTDLSPSGAVVGIDERLRFRHLDTTTVLIPPGAPRAQVVDDPAEVLALLAGADREIHRDHSGAAAAHHVVLRSGEEHCYVVYRRDRRKRLPVFASVLHVGNPALFRRTSGDLARHLLLRHGVLTLAERRTLRAPAPDRAVLLSRSRPKMFRSDRLGADAVDDLYSELTCVAW